MFEVLNPLRRVKTLARLSLAVLALLTAHTMTAQNVFARKNLTSIPVDQLSESQIIQFKKNFGGARSTTSKQGLLGAQSGEGASMTLLLLQEIERIRDSIRSVSSLNEMMAGDNLLRKRLSADSLVFGQDLFSSKEFKFEPNMTMAAPKNYVLGPGDEISLDIYGFQENSEELSVLKDGRIRVDRVGMVSIAGLTIEAAESKLKKLLAENGYRTILSGQTKVSITVSKLRSIQVTVVGTKRPGQYTLPSVAGVFHAVFAGGGPGVMGSYRNIMVRRGSQVVDTFDLYNVLIKGDLSSELRLEDGDVVFVPTYGTRISVSGEVKRPFAFELKDGESLKDLLDFAGGFTDAAAKDYVSIERFGANKELLITDAAITEAGSTFLTSGDEVTVHRVSDRLQQFLAIGGAVYVPGVYGAEAGITIEQALKKAGGLLPEAYTGRGLVMRTLPDLTKEFYRFSASNGSDLSFSLMPGDSIAVMSLETVFGERTVEVSGAVYKPGIYPFGAGMTVQDAIMIAGGLTGQALRNEVEVARPKKDNPDESEYFQVPIDEGLSLRNDEFQLEFNDVVMVRIDERRRPQRVVAIEGEVNRPGPYVMVSREDRLSALVKRAGGFTPYADQDGGILLRTTRLSQADVFARERLKQSKLYTKDSSKFDFDMDTSSLRVDTIALNIRASMRNPGGRQDFVLKRGDKVIVPEFVNMVRITGGVNYPTQVAYEANTRLGHYLRRAGGPLKGVKRRDSFVVYPNGETRVPRGLPGLKVYPLVRPGSTIVVPIPEEDKGSKAIDAVQLSAVASALGALSTVAVLLRSLLP
jgi:protein involved in polysaccharide export with SLBB domain